ELSCEFEGGVIDDRGFAALLDLLEELPNQHRLAGACVAHDQEMAGLKGSRNLKRLGVPNGRPSLDERNPVRAPSTIERSDRKELRTLQATTVSPAPSAEKVHGNRDNHSSDANHHTGPQTHTQEPDQSLISINPSAKKCVQRRMCVVALHPPERLG